MGAVKHSELKNLEPEIGSFVLNWLFIEKIE